MAKKLRKLKIEADGTIILGIHKIPPPPKPIPIDGSREYLKQWVEGFNRSAFESIAEMRQYLRDIVIPHLDGPISQEQIKNLSLNSAAPGSYYGLDMGSGPEVYRAKQYMLLYSNNLKTRGRAIAAFEELDEEEQVAALKAIDAVEELNELRVATLHLNESGSRDFLFRTAFRCGWMYKQMQVRHFEGHVRSERGRRNRRPETGAKLTNNQWVVVKEVIQSLINKGNSAASACETAHAQLATGVLRGLKGQRIEISAKSLRNRWSRRNQ